MFILLIPFYVINNYMVGSNMEMDLEEYKKEIRNLKPHYDVVAEPGEYDEFKKLGIADMLYIMTGIDLRRNKPKIKDKKY